ncbi:MAG TPA: helix-turn-helix domain-containing protein, partial [Nitrobacter sp.]|nr:helix-turn-helix domain-containing protein [Nitrobacter sp.]
FNCKPSARPAAAASRSSLSPMKISSSSAHLIGQGAGMNEKTPETTEETLILWTPEQVCQALACRRSWLYDQVEARRIPVVRLGRQLRFRPDDVTAYLDAHSQPAATTTPPPISGLPRRRRRRTVSGFSPRT